MSQIFKNYYQNAFTKVLLLCCSHDHGTLQKYPKGLITLSKQARS